MAKRRTFYYYFNWIDDDCASIKCKCEQEDILISTGHPTRCPSCKRVWQLEQITRAYERKEENLPTCPKCGELLADGSDYCVPCAWKERGLA